MLPLWKWTPAVFLSANLLLSSADAQQLQWQHASNSVAKRPTLAAKQSVPAQQFSAPSIASADVKRPADDEPAPLPANLQAKPIAPKAASVGPRTDDTQVRRASATRYNTASSKGAAVPQRTFARKPRTTTLQALARAIQPTQHEEIMPPSADGEMMGGPYPMEMGGAYPMEGYPSGCCDDGCCPNPCGPGGCCDGCTGGCCGEVGCGVPGGYVEPGCGVYGDTCIGIGCPGGCAGGVCEPDCAYREPSCGCGGVGCGDCCDTCVEPRGCVPIYIYVPPIREFTVFGGVQGFKSPYDNPNDRGNFGFHEGINIGGEMSWLAIPGLAYQVGFRATQSQLNDAARSHSQQFMTTGLFRRRPRGLQYGVVFDLAHDERRGGGDFDQVRGEISWGNGFGRWVGFSFASQTNARNTGGVYQSADQYLIFYRVCGQRGGEVRLFAGLDDESNGIFGTDFSVPLNQRWSFEGNWTYLTAEDIGAGAAANESWNLGMSLVWHWGCRSKISHRSPYRPMFNVADNGSMIITDR